MPDALNTVINLEGAQSIRLALLGILGYGFALHLACIIWAARDITSRTRLLVVQVLTILFIAGTSVFGVILYLILRPVRTIEEREYDALERKALADIMEKQKAETVVTVTDKEEKKEKKPVKKDEEEGDKKKKEK